MFNKILSPKATITLFTVLLGALVGLALPGPSAQTQDPNDSVSSSQPTLNNSDNAQGQQNAATTRPPDPPPRPSQYVSDSTFAKKAAQSNLYEIKAAQLAEQQAEQMRDSVSTSANAETGQVRPVQ